MIVLRTSRPVRRKATDTIALGAASSRERSTAAEFRRLYPSTGFGTFRGMFSREAQAGNLACLLKAMARSV